MRYIGTPPKNEHRLDALIRENEERVARCRALDTRLREMGMDVRYPPFTPSDRTQRMGWGGVYEVERECRDHLDRVERLLLLALSVKASDSASTDGGPSRSQ